MLDQAIALKLIHGKPWHHDFEIIEGVRTHGAYNPTALWNELNLPEDMSDLTLADVGASNGYFSFEARKRGARVVAFDYRHKDNSGFGLAQYINGMHDIEHYQVNVLKIRPEQFGKFDIVLALGLLYHVSDPYLALANCAALSRKTLLIESYCIDKPINRFLKPPPIMRFIADPIRFPGYGNVNNDRSNFWGFTSACLQQMVEDIGFAVDRKDVRDARVFLDARRVVSDLSHETRYLLAHGSVVAQPRGENPNDPDSWIIF
jgi:tRNA (mo5U34)-methyltransferase